MSATLSRLNLVITWPVDCCTPPLDPTTCAIVIEMIWTCPCIVAPLYCIGATIVSKTPITLCDAQIRFESEKNPSWMHENHQATIKTRYCGHLYSPLLHKWTYLAHRVQVSYHMGGVLKGTWRDPFLLGKGGLIRFLVGPLPLLWVWKMVILYGEKGIERGAWACSSL